MRYGSFVGGGRLAVVALVLAGAACSQDRERPADLPREPYAQSEAIPDRLQQRGGRPVYVVTRVENGMVHLEPATAAPDAATRPRRQGDPVYEWMVTADDYRRLSGTDATPGARVELEMNPTGRPYRIDAIDDTP